ncbi:uncharacterized protein LOC114340291 isoform X2 [Diabrotica virgifera virgifera]|nr:uncharacterized protein LOC114340291 isoform X2 [Diabrotica virgifera virgifera]XP_050497720.1 uncharacterized protein LOC114340291 isoform X2 [Diabrotica virgifera virgifera]XP_050497721.1 uncharacterized protein LOC114340291 isoform X2 [Diabrotica virgifera virgifera]
MALRKEEERKQMHNKTGGGVFNLIFRRGKSSMGSGSISSDTRSISPTHSDDSRSVTPPAVIQQPILPPPKQDPPPERPKPPQRKRRPAPRPPQLTPPQQEIPKEETAIDAEDSKESRRNSEEKPASTVSEVSELQSKKIETGLVICHSRNSSDSSGYHEASVLSDNCNTSLPRRPKSAFVGSTDIEKLSKMHSQSTTNLTKMASHSKSTTSLGLTGRKKKAAPPPPPAVRASNPSINLEPASPVVASQSTTHTKATPSTSLDPLVAPNLPKPLPRGKTKAPPVPRPRSEIITVETIIEDIDDTNNKPSKVLKIDNDVVQEVIKEVVSAEVGTESSTLKKDIIVTVEQEIETLNDEITKEKGSDISELAEIPTLDDSEDISHDKNEEKYKIEDSKNTSELVRSSLDVDIDANNNTNSSNVTEYSEKLAYDKIRELQKISHGLLFSSPAFKRHKEQESRTTKPISKSEKIEDVKEKSIHKDVNNVTADVKETVLKQDIARINKTRNDAEIQEDIKVDCKDDEAIKDIRETVLLPEQEIQIENSVNVLPDIEKKVVATEVTPETKIEEMQSNVKQESSELGPISSELTLSKKLPPEIVAVIPKTLSDKKLNPSNKYDSFGKRRVQKLFSISSLSEDENGSKSGSVSSRTSVSSALGAFNFVDEFSDLDDKVFTGSISKNFSLKDEDFFNELYGIHHLEDFQLKKNQSVCSLRSLSSLPGFLNSGSGMRKWVNTEGLDGLSISEDPNFRWVIGDSEPESLSSHQALDNLASITSCAIDTLTDSTDVIKPFGSTDSGIAPETNEKLSEVEDLRPITPPPPPIFVDEPTEFVEPGKEPHEELQEKVEERLEEALVIEEAEKSIEPISETITSENESLTELGIETEKENLEEIDWQYQLPSPPKAFRDSSPIRNEDTLSEAKSVSITDFKDSVVTSPELFEKLKSIEDTQSVQSVSTFVGEEPPLNTLSLENLEKRKTLVYNRELSSLKMNEKNTFSHSLNKFERTYIEVQKSSQKEMREPKFVPKSNTNTLPNFKISTYDRPKQKIKVFEDDTVRSNTEYINRSKETVIERQTYSSNVNRSFAATSMENISARKISVDSQPEEREYNFFRPDKVNTARNFGPVSSVFRSESFSKENTWSPPKPVSRSKSFLTLNWQGKYKIEKQNKEGEGMERINSLYDVSGLQSLGVMRLIQNKLNTPTTSLENINAPDQSKAKIDHPRETPITKLSPVETIEKPLSTERIYKYRGPPSINMGTWCDRPKVPVSVKEDEDYTLGNTVSTKLIVNTTNNNVTSNNRIEIKTSNKEVQSSNEPSISIKVNGSEVPTTTTDTKTGNVVIKIGPSSNSQPKIIDNQTFINHTTAVGYRKPFNDINKNQRPYSIAFSSEYDMSRVPVVRSVELKKPFKDFGNTSVTQISPDATADNKPHNGFLEDRKAALRINSFTPHGAPVVRGFKSLPKQKESFQPNSQVPFSQVTLRRTESSKILNEPKEPEVKPPPPPMMPKVSLKKPTIKHVEPILDPRDQLLSQIRNFGGKKGLKSVKV